MLCLNIDEKKDKEKKKIIMYTFKHDREAPFVTNPLLNAMQNLSYVIKSKRG